MAELAALLYRLILFVQCVQLVGIFCLKQQHGRSRTALMRPCRMGRTWASGRRQPKMDVADGGPPTTGIPRFTAV